jgi:NADH-quinone oxidoreductase subunit E
MNIPAELEKQIDEVITHYPASKRSASLPLLHLVQEHFGFISDEAIEWIAKKLELQPINIYELVTFYPMFRRHPAGKTHIRVCRTLSCAMGGADRLMKDFCELAEIKREAHEHHGSPITVSADGKYSIEYVECLASCGTAPVCMVNDEFFENVRDKQTADQILKTVSKA